MDWSLKMVCFSLLLVFLQFPLLTRPCVKSAGEGKMFAGSIILSRAKKMGFELRSMNVIISTGIRELQQSPHYLDHDIEVFATDLGKCYGRGI